AGLGRSCGCWACSLRPASAAAGSASASRASRAADVALADCAAVASRPMELWIAMVGAVAVLIACMVVGGKGWRPERRGWLFTAFALLVIAVVAAVAWDAANSPGGFVGLGAGGAGMLRRAAGGGRGGACPRCAR